MRIKILLMIFMLVQSLIAEGGGDDGGNGGFAFKQSVKLLEIATEWLTPKIESTSLPILKENPEWRKILAESLTYSNLIQLDKVDDQYRSGKLLAMDYDPLTNQVKIYKPYYEAFAGTADDQLNVVAPEVQKRLLHEASHLWGYNEIQAEQFSLAFMRHNGSIYDEMPDRDNITIDEASMCVCRGNKNLRPQNPICQKFCSEQNANNNDKILFAKAELSENDLKNPNLGDLDKWCRAPLRRNFPPSCRMKITKPDGIWSALINITPGSNFFTVILTGVVDFRTPYKIQMENSVGVTSNELNLVMQIPTRPVEALKIDSLNRYYCQFRAEGPVGKRKLRQTFSYLNYSSPPTVPSDERNVVCHDVVKYGKTDDPRFPRLGLEKNTLTLFSLDDPRFQDSDADMRWDINQLIGEDLFDEYGIDIYVNVFTEFKLPVQFKGNDVSKGFIIPPFYSKTNGKFSCPTKEDYEGENPFFRVLGKYLKRDTEPLYAVTSIVDILKPKDFFVIKKSELEKIWFIYEDGVEVRPRPEQEESPYALFFYWPQNLAEPLKKHSNQTTYRVIENEGRSGEMSESANQLMIGCAPVQ